MTLSLRMVPNGETQEPPIGSSSSCRSQRAFMGIGIDRAVAGTQSMGSSSGEPSLTGVVATAVPIEPTLPSRPGWTGLVDPAFFSGLVDAAKGFRKPNALNFDARALSPFLAVILLGSVLLTPDETGRDLVRTFGSLVRCLRRRLDGVGILLECIMVWALRFREEGAITR